MPDAYATEAEATAFLTASALTGFADGEIERWLLRASEVLDDTVRVAFAVDTVTFLPTDEDIATAMRDACCAQVEFWLEVGEDHDVTGLAGRQASVGHLSLSALPPECGPRARRILSNAGLLNPIPTTASLGSELELP